MKPISVAQKIAELKSEISFRKVVYQNKVNAGSMTREQRDHKIRIMEEILLDYTNNRPAIQQANLFQQ